MNKSLNVLLILGIYCNLQSALIEASVPTCTLTIPIVAPKISSPLPSLTFSHYGAGNKRFSASDVIAQLAIGLQIIDHLRRNPPHLPLGHRIRHFFRKQPDHENQKGVVKKSQEAADEFITLFTPTVTTTPQTIAVRVQIGALQDLDSNTRQQTYKTIQLITGKKFTPRPEPFKKTLRKLQ